MKNNWRWCLAGALMSGLTIPSVAQELEVRRWSHLPSETNFAAVAYAYTAADIALDPALLIENAELEMHTVVAAYIRTFKLFDKSARVDFVQAYQDGKWTGTLNGVPASVQRSGLADSIARLAIHLYGAPPLSGEDYAAYRAEANVETFVGAAIAVQLPTGEYLDDKLINLGTNRFTFQPQLGVVHNRGPWSFEATAIASLYTDNEEFFDGNVLEQDPFYTLEGHVVYRFRPGLWLGAGAGYGYGGEKTVNGERKDDRQENLAWGLGFGYPITRRWGIKVVYIGTRTQESVGFDSDTIAFSLSTFW